MDFVAQGNQSSTARWTITNPQGTTLEAGKEVYLRRIVARKVSRPNCNDVDHVSIFETDHNIQYNFKFFMYNFTFLHFYAGFNSHQRSELSLI